ncbi:MAG: hypothetical protein ACKVX7_11515 [Planctomycetota bacterium]
MHVSSFLSHWQLNEHPFLAEEARLDTVFSRLAPRTRHPDFAKVLGDPARPGTAVVFGEKGSGKTAMRLQIEAAVRTHNDARPDTRIWVIAYDELNPMLDSFCRRAGARSKSPEETLAKLTLVDHIDGMLSVATPGLVDLVLAGATANGKALRLDAATRQDVAMLAALYDRGAVPERAARLRRRLGFWAPSRLLVTRWLALTLVVLFGAAALGYRYTHGPESERDLLLLIALGALGVVALAAGIRAGIEAARVWRLAHRVHRQVRVIERSPGTLRHALERLPTPVLGAASFPIDALDESRYQLLDRFRRAIAPLGYVHVLVLFDRLDEPTLVSGDTRRMRAVAWPLFNNKFLQQPGFAIKMMLPLELRHELRRESSEFFQEARLDKQSLVERLSWSGATLYDLCSERLVGCRAAGAEPLSLVALFGDDVNRQDLIDALDQMRQPRDAFKLLYQVIQEHCTHTPEESAVWRIPRLTLDHVRRAQSGRLEELQRGIGPA